jgi:hypothetical protein
MGSLLANVIVLALIAALSPTILAGILWVLGGRRNPLPSGFGLFAGVGLSVALLIIVGACIGAGIQLSKHISHTRAVMDVTVGGVLIITGILSFFRKGRTEREVETPSPSSSDLPMGKPWKLAVLGIVLTITDLKIVTLSLIAGREIVLSRIDSLDKALVYVIFWLLALSSASIPLVYYTISPERSSRVFPAILQFVRRRGDLVMAIICLLFGAHLLSKGLHAL